jgi:hypothetical protein
VRSSRLVVLFGALTVTMVLLVSSTSFRLNQALSRHPPACVPQQLKELQAEVCSSKPHSEACQLHTVCSNYPTPFVLSGYTPVRVYRRS